MKDTPGGGRLSKRDIHSGGPGLLPRLWPKDPGPDMITYPSFSFLSQRNIKFSIENRNKQTKTEIIQDPSRKIIKICVVVLPCSNTGLFHLPHFFFFY